MCNLYSHTKGQTAILEATRATIDRSGNLPPMPGIFPDCTVPIVRNTLTRRGVMVGLGSLACCADGRVSLASRVPYSGTINLDVSRVVLAASKWKTGQRLYGAIEASHDDTITEYPDGKRVERDFDGPTHSVTGRIAMIIIDEDGSSEAFSEVTIVVPKKSPALIHFRSGPAPRSPGPKKLEIFAGLHGLVDAQEFTAAAGSGRCFLGRF